MSICCRSRQLAAAMLVAMGATILAPSVVSAQHPPELSAETRQLASGIAAAVAPNQAARLYAKLLQGTDRSTLGQLQHVPETGVALRAAFEAAVRQRTDERIDPRALAKFLGFVEGRLAIELPDWWEETVMNAQIQTDYGKSVLPLPDAWLGDKWPRDLPELVEIEESSDRAKIRLGKQLFLANPEVLQLRAGIRGNTAGLLEKDDCFLALHSDSGMSYPLVCLDRRTGEIRWKSDVWAGNSDWVVIGRWHEIVSIRAKGEQLFVIGSGIAHVYIECFDRQTGNPVFRFVNWYSAEVHPRPPTRF